MSTIVSFNSLQIRPNQGPLTSVFTPPSDCLSYWTSYSSEDAILGGYGDIPEPSCIPRNYEYGTIYSPGVCPDGYTFRDGTTSGYAFPTELDGSSTIRRCCPGGLEPVTELTGWCSTILPSGTSYEYVTSDASASILTSSSWETDVTLYGVAIFVAYESTDTDIFTLLPQSVVPLVVSSTTAAPGASSNGGPENTGASTPTPSSPNADIDITREHRGMSTEAKVGIGIGVSLGVIFIALIVGFWIWLARRYRQTPAVRNSAMVEANGDMADQSEYVVKGTGQGRQS